MAYCAGWRWRPILSLDRQEMRGSFFRLPVAVCLEAVTIACVLDRSSAKTMLEDALWVGCALADISAAERRESPKPFDQLDLCFCGEVAVAKTPPSVLGFRVFRRKSLKLKNLTALGELAGRRGTRSGTAEDQERPSPSCEHRRTVGSNSQSSVLMATFLRARPR